MSVVRLALLTAAAAAAAAGGFITPNSNPLKPDPTLGWGLPRGEFVDASNVYTISRHRAGCASRTPPTYLPTPTPPTALNRLPLRTDTSQTCMSPVSIPSFPALPPSHYLNTIPTSHSLGVRAHHPLLYTPITTSTRVPTALTASLPLLHPLSSPMEPKRPSRRCQTMSYFFISSTFISSHIPPYPPPYPHPHAERRWNRPTPDAACGSCPLGLSRTTKRPSQEMSRKCESTARANTCHTHADTTNNSTHTNTHPPLDVGHERSADPQPRHPSGPGQSRAKEHHHPRGDPLDRQDRQPQGAGAHHCPRYCRHSNIMNTSIPIHFYPLTIPKVNTHRTIKHTHTHKNHTHTQLALPRTPTQTQDHQHQHRTCIQPTSHSGHQ